MQEGCNAPSWVQMWPFCLMSLPDYKWGAWFCCPCFCRRKEEAYGLGLALCCVLLPIIITFPSAFQNTAGWGWQLSALSPVQKPLLQDCSFSLLLLLLFIYCCSFLSPSYSPFKLKAVLYFCSESSLLLLIFFLLFILRNTIKMIRNTWSLPFSFLLRRSTWHSAIDALPFLGDCDVAAGQADRLSHYCGSWDLDHSHDNVFKIRILECRTQVSSHVASIVLRTPKKLERWGWEASGG